MKKILSIGLFLVSGLLHAQTFPVNNLQVNGTANVAGATTVHALSATSIVSPSITNGTTTFYSTVPTNAGLIALPTTTASTVTRLGFYSSGDSPAVTYTASGSICSLNSGAGDNGSQVPSADGKCWIGNMTMPYKDIRIWGAHVDGVTDDSTFVQADINYLQNNVGGIVYFPSGTTLINAGITVSTGGVTLRGDGWQEYTPANPNTFGPHASWILTTNTSNTPVTFANTSTNSVIQDIGFRQPQPVDSVGWTPTVFAPTIVVQGGGLSGAVLMERLFCYICYSFIQIGSTGQGTGRITMNHIYGEPLSSGIKIIFSADTNTINDVHFWPFYGAGINGNILNWQYANGVALTVARSDNLKIINWFDFGYNIGFSFISGSDGGTQRFHFTDIDMDSTQTGINFAGGANASNGQIENFTVTSTSGAPNTSNGIFVASGVQGLTVDITNFRSTIAGASCIASGATSADIAVVNSWCDNWNQSNTTIVAYNAASAGTTFTFGGRFRVNGGNGASNTGGGGVINNSHVN